MADVCEVGMIVVRSEKGISHHPDKYSTHEDIAIGTELFLRTTVQMAIGEPYKN